MSHTGTELEMGKGEQQTLAQNLGVTALEEEPITWSNLAGRIESESRPEFESMGEAIRDTLDGRLDDRLLARERENLEIKLDQIPEVRSAGIPDDPVGLYEEVAMPGWRIYDHLVDVGFFESLDETLPGFTADHVVQTARKLILTDPLSSALDRNGFDEREKTALLAAVVNNNERLARWVPTNQIPDGVEFDTANVPPLYQRAAGGALLWIRGLDRHLWQNEVLITDAILDDAIRHVKAMLGGLYVTTIAARDVAAEADERTLTDGQLTAAFTAGAAIQIVSQEELMRDAFYITDDMRAPSELR